MVTKIGPGNLASLEGNVPCLWFLLLKLRNGESGIIAVRSCNVDGILYAYLPGDDELNTSSIPG